MNFIQRPPLIHRLLIPGAIWRRRHHDDPNRKVAYLTFDDGPIPEVTPWVLDTLERLQVKATFFLVGENVERNPSLLAQIISRGHSVGNHTMHHDRGIKCSRGKYLESISKAGDLIPGKLFRPPHGFLRPSQLLAVRKTHTIVMHDLVTMDYDSRQWPWEIIRRVHKLIRPGSIIVFHDSLKAQKNLKATLENVIQFLIEDGYTLLPLPQG